MKVALIMLHLMDGLKPIPFKTRLSQSLPSTSGWLLLTVHAVIPSIADCFLPVYVYQVVGIAGTLHYGSAKLHHHVL